MARPLGRIRTHYYVSPVLSKLQKSMEQKYKIYPRSKVEKLITDFIEEHKLYADFVNSPCEGLTYVRFVVEEDEEDE